MLTTSRYFRVTWASNSRWSQWPGSRTDTLVDERADHLSAHPRPAAVDENPIEPGVDPLEIAQLPPVERGQDRGVMDGILGIRSVAEKQAS